MLDFAAAVFLGNLMTASFVWGFLQFNKHDYQAPWLAYAGCLMPIGFALLCVLATEGLPPQFDALALQQDAGSPR